MQTTAQTRARLIRLPVFTMTDQPETCPECGTRTDFAEATDGRQLHTCPAPRCGYSYILEPAEG